MPTTRKQPETPVEPSTPAAPAALSRLARAQATVQAADEARQLITSEISTLQERQRKTDREMADLDRNAEGAADVGARLDRRLALQQELTGIADMLPTLTQRHRHADQKLTQARDEEAAVRLRIAGFRRRIDEQQGRIRRQQRAIEEAESLVVGHRNGLANLERSVATIEAELEQMAGAD